MEQISEGCEECMSRTTNREPSDGLCGDAILTILPVLWVTSALLTEMRVLFLLSIVPFVLFMSSHSLLLFVRPHNTFPGNVK